MFYLRCKNWLYFFLKSSHHFFPLEYQEPVLGVEILDSEFLSERRKATQHQCFSSCLPAVSPRTVDDWGDSTRDPKVPLNEKRQANSSLLQEQASHRQEWGDSALIPTQSGKSPCCCALAPTHKVSCVSVLSIWWCPCIESFLVLLEEDVCYDQCVLLAKLY